MVCSIPSIWTGLYRKTFLEREGISLRETPGAAFQDAGFSLKVWFAARTCALVKKSLLHYRMDNPGSSSKTTDKVFTVCEELADAETFYASVLSAPASCCLGLPLTSGESTAGTTSAFPLASTLPLRSAWLTSTAHRRMRTSWTTRCSSPKTPLCCAICSTSARSVCGGSSRFVLRTALLKFSIIVAAYNVERYIGECLESLKAQTFGDFDCVVVNDARKMARLPLSKAPFPAMLDSRC
mgnify:CR=1 FL=1